MVSNVRNTYNHTLLCMQSDILKKLRLKVLVRNCTEFVQLLMDYGVQFDKDFTVKELAKLYEKVTI